MAKLPSELILPETALPLAYSAHHQWGSIHVTNTAVEEFQLVPLVPVIEGGDILKRTVNDYDPLSVFTNIDIFVVGTDQLVQPPELLTSASPNTEVFARSLRYKNGLGIALTPTITIEKAETDIAAQAKLFLNRTRSLLTGDDGEPMTDDEFKSKKDELLQQLHEQGRAEIPQIVSHDLASQIEGVVATSITDYLALLHQKRMISGAKRAVLAPLATAAGIGTLDTAFMGGVGLPQLAIIALFTGNSARMGIKSVKESILSQQAVAERRERAASLTAQLVSQDVHVMFCRAHFERRFGDTL